MRLLSSVLGYLYTVETEIAYQVVATCHRCKSIKVPEHKVFSFVKWLWPKDAATMKQEMQDVKKK